MKHSTPENAPAPREETLRFLQLLARTYNPLTHKNIGEAIAAIVPARCDTMAEC